MAAPLFVDFASANSGSATSLSAAWNSGSAPPAGYLMIAMAACNGAMTFTGPSGWATLFSDSGGATNYMGFGVWWKTSSGSEPSTVTVGGLTGVRQVVLSCASYSNAVATAPQFAMSNGIVATGLTTGTITPAVSGSLEVTCWAGEDGGSANTISGWTQEVNSAYGGYICCTIQHNNTATTLASVSATTSFASSTTPASYNSGILVIAPVATAAVTPVISDSVHAGAASGSITATWQHGAPAKGSVLVAIGITNVNDTIAAPVGWVALLNGPPIMTAFGMGLFYKVAGTSEPTSYVWKSTTGASNLDISLVCIVGGSPAEPQVSIAGMLSGNNISTSPLVPTTLNSLALAGFLAGQSVTAFSLASGWTTVTGGYSPYASTIQTRTALTSNLSTPITTSTTFVGTETSAGAFGIIIAPASAIVFTKRLTGTANLAVFGERLAAMLYSVVMTISGSFRATIKHGFSAFTSLTGATNKRVGFVTSGSLLVNGVRLVAHAYAVTFAALTIPAALVSRSLARALSIATTVLSAVFTSSHSIRSLVQTFSGGLAVSGGIAKGIGRTAFAGSLLAGGTARRTLTRVFVAIGSNNGTIARVTSRGLSAVAGVAGAFLKARLVAFGAVLHGAGAITKNIAHGITATLINIGAVAFIKAKVLAFAASTSLSTTIVRATARSLAAALNNAGARIWRMSRRLSGSLSTLGAAANLHQHFATLTAYVLPAGQDIGRGIYRVFATTVTLLAFYGTSAANYTSLFFTSTTTLVSDVLGQTLQRVWAATTTPQASLTKTVARTLASAAIAFSSAITRIVRALLPPGSERITGAVARSAQRVLSGFTAISGSQVRVIRYALAAASNLVGSPITKVVRRTYSASMAAVGLFARYVSKRFVAAATLAGSNISRAMTRIVSAAFTLSGTIGQRARTLFLSGTWRVTGTTTKASRRVLQAVSSAAAAITKQAHAFERGSVVATSRLIKTRQAVFAGSVASLGRLTSFAFMTYALVFTATSMWVGVARHTTTRIYAAVITPFSQIRRTLARTFAAFSIPLGSTVKQWTGRLFAGVIALAGSIAQYWFPPPTHQRHRTISTPITNQVTLSTPIYPGARESRTPLF